ncbi:MAG: 3-oxoacyl-[acyl-carrier protein] reductase [Pseudonocardiales bacterium]|nr:3-oxoacyl-[acyl-carrier protein] reductase [Pseudonocardiales bacterium]
MTADPIASPAAPPTYGFEPGLLSGRVAVISAAGGAIGSSIATIMASLGADVIAADIDRERLAALESRVRSAGRGTITTVVTDLCTESGVAELAEVARAGGRRVDILVNGLGEHLASAAPIELGTEQMWQRLYEVNLLHVFRLCREFVPMMKAGGWGRILNFSSVEGARAAPDLAVYAAFKRAIDGFTKSLAVELAPSGIIVTAIAVDKTRAYQVGHYQLPDEYQRLVPVWVPAGHYAEPEEVATLAVFLAGPMNTWVVGDTVTADGGTLSAGGWFRTPARWTNQPLLVQYLEDPAVNATRPPAVQ